MALTVCVTLVVLGREIDRHRESWLALQNFGRVRGGRDLIAHLREGRGEKGMMSVVGPRDP